VEVFLVGFLRGILGGVFGLSLIVPTGLRVRLVDDFVDVFFDEEDVLLFDVVFFFVDVVGLFVVEVLEFFVAIIYLLKGSLLV
jgi:hypothetical protein